VTFKFFSDGECRHTVTIPSGEIPEIPEIIKTGYTLTGWTLGKETPYDASRALIIGNETESVDLHAVYVPNTYTVTFDFGYDRTEKAQTFGEALDLPEASERSGYTFVGWFTMEDGKGEQLTNGASFMSAENVTYYAYYRETGSVLSTVLICLGAVILVVGGTAWFFIGRKKKKAVTESEATQAAAETAQSVPTEQRIVKTRYTDEEIDRIVNSTNEAQLLTERELEVFRELLKGKKQSEIGYYLGITVPTVKDNAGRIYSKFGVSNKNALFELIDSKISKEQ